MSERPYIVGNWKMHGTRAMLAEARAIDRAAERLMRTEVAIAPPFTLIHAVRKEANLIAVGGQDCHPEESGAHTGDVSASMVKDAGASFVILGHSERRQNHGEDNALVKRKMAAAFDVGLNVILCVGETAEERDAGKAEAAVFRQLEESLVEVDTIPERLTVAYEPVWAIGTGRSASVEEIGAMHSALRGRMGELLGMDGEGVRIIYGGSVNADNITEILGVDDVDGALVGGASLTAESFLGIIIAAASPDADS
ncbi:triose-phosphate isomerase [Alteriqipengyuania sp. WL0013]|uniref:triose-phosphate isomerase n=1 Tax=Alteriqipengyuania sp. WL0013 TaxID=3110773 RepID=UPI002BE9FD01|nr:triose-phosphate isomerase [Alteriqipengyuania sp. WL0013]MEB3414850.1 triose-phosphate isomerase [Alteriqipengyuania sp. WL0013]